MGELVTPNDLLLRWRLHRRSESFGVTNSPMQHNSALAARREQLEKILPRLFILTAHENPFLPHEKLFNPTPAVSAAHIALQFPRPPASMSSSEKNWLRNATPGQWRRHRGGRGGRLP